MFDLRPNDADLPKVRVEATNLSVLFAAGDNWGLKGEFLTGRSIDWFAMARTGIRLNSLREVDAKLEDHRKVTLRSKIVPHPERSRADVDAEVGAELASYGIR